MCKIWASIGRVFARTLRTATWGAVLKATGSLAALYLDSRPRVPAERSAVKMPQRTDSRRASDLERSHWDWPLVRAGVRARCRVWHCAQLRFSPCWAEHLPPLCLRGTRAENSRPISLDSCRSEASKSKIPRQVQCLATLVTIPLEEADTSLQRP